MKLTPAELADWNAEQERITRSLYVTPEPQPEPAQNEFRNFDSRSADYWESISELED